MEKTVYIERLSALGDGVARQSGKVCFVPYACPGDTLKIRITQSKPKFERGQIVEILEPGPGRRSPPCPLFQNCGGCPWLHLTDIAQQEAKQHTLARALESESISWVPSRKSLGYRRLARLHYAPAPKTLGFMVPGRRHVVPIPRCPVLVDGLNDTLSHLREILEVLGHPVEIRLSLGQDGPAAVIHSRSPLSPPFYDQVRKTAAKSFSGIIANVDGVTSTLHGISHVESLGFDRSPLLEPAASFGQANHWVNQELVGTVSSWITERNYKHALELFAGSGNLTIAIAPLVKRTTTVEWDSDACRAAQLNIDNRGLGRVTVMSGDALEVYQGLKQNFDLIVLDPPRTGARELVEAIKTSSANAVLYVSCNPATLSRDIGVLAGGGFRLVKAKGFDMFPQTPHIEAAALLER